MHSHFFASTILVGYDGIMKKAKKLTSKQSCFCLEYMVDLNATKAAIRAGYSERSARQIGQENLSKHDIQEEIQTLLRKKTKDREITIERVIDELAAIAFFKVSDFYKVNNAGELVVNLKAVIDSNSGIILENTKYGVRLKTQNKIKALEILANYVGLFDKSQKIVNDSDQIDYSGISTEKLRSLQSAWTANN